jgi:hypothetical protein
MNNLRNAADELKNKHESTYALLIRSEEKSRNLFEIAVYPLLILSAIIAIWQFVLQAVELPLRNPIATKRFISANDFHSRFQDRHLRIETLNRAIFDLAET